MKQKNRVVMVEWLNNRLFDLRELAEHFNIACMVDPEQLGNEFYFVNEKLWDAKTDGDQNEQN